MKKRGHITNISRFRKLFSIKPLSIAISGVLLAGCGSNKEEVLIAHSPEDCVSKTSMTLEECDIAYKHALAEARRTGPRYSTLTDCAAEFGQQSCHQPLSSSNIFMPFMAGWMISSAINSNQRQMYNPVFKPRLYRNNNYNREEDYMSASGGYINYSGSGRYTASTRDVNNKAPTMTRTLSRGGFGSTASAKSSWGGGSKSSSWGG